MASSLIRTATALVIAFSLCASAVGQGSNRNAATWYQRAIDQYTRTFTQQQRDAVDAYLDNPAAPPSPEVREVIDQSQTIFNFIRRGTAQPYCDFSLDRSQGFELLLPHLPPMRQIGRLMSIDALIRLNDGDAASSASRIADLYRMSSQFNDDHVLISSLVGQSVFNQADRTLQMAIDRGAFGPAESAAVLAGLGTLSKTDPFEYVEAVASEQEMTVGYLASKFQDPAAWQQLAEQAGVGRDSPDMQQMMALDEKGFKEQLDQYDQLMSQMVEAFSLSDPEQAKTKIGELERKIEGGEVGVLCRALMPALGKCLERKLEGEKKLADRITLLEAMSKGLASMQETANAAVFYLRGIELLERLDPVKLQAFRDVAANPSAPITDEMTATLQSSVEILDYFRLGADIKRCDFSFARPRDQLALAPSYAPGMHDALRMIQVEALLHLRAGDKNSAATVLALALQVCGHLNADPVLASSLIAHVDFNRTMALVQQGLDSGTLDDACKKVMSLGLARVSRRDPFGYIGSVVESRKTLAARFTHRNPRDESQQAQWAAIAAQIKTWNADQLMFVATVFDTMTRAGQQQQQNSSATQAVASTSLPATANPQDKTDAPADSGKPKPPDPQVRLADVFSLPRVEDVRNQVATIAPMIARDDWSFIEDARSLPAIARPNGVVDRMHSARADLRRAMMLLKPPDDAAKAAGENAAATRPDEDENHD